MPLYKRPDSKFWWIKIGESTRFSSGTTDRAEAEEVEREYQNRHWREKKLGDRGATLWTVAVERYLKKDAKPRKRDREILAWLEPHIGNSSIADVANPDVFEQLRTLAEKVEGWSQATTDRMMAVVSAVLRYCSNKLRWIDVPPSVPMYRPPPEDPRWLTPEQFEALCAELPEHLELAARLAVATLLRMREMTRLTWDRVDIERAQAWVPRRDRKGKTRAISVPLSTEALRVLHELRALNPEGNRVFQWKGGALDDCNTNAFKEALNRAGVGPLRWHELRHTGASWAAMSGVGLKELQELGGWSDLRMVLRYAHLAPSSVAQAAEKLARFGHGAKDKAKLKKVKA